MPGYPGQGQAALLYENKQVFLFNNEALAVGSHSIAVELRRTRGAYYPWGAAFELSFSGAPGTFEVDIEGSESDTPNSYQKLGSITTVNSSNYGRFDMLANYPKFVRATVVSLANSVNGTLLATR